VLGLEVYGRIFNVRCHVRWRYFQQSDLRKEADNLFISIADSETMVRLMHPGRLGHVFLYCSVSKFTLIHKC